MRTSATASSGKDVIKINSSVEAQRTIIIDINPVALVVTRSVQHRDLPCVRIVNPVGKMRTYIASLDKVAGHEKVLLVRRNLDVVGTNNGLILIGVIQTLDVIEVGNVEGSDVVAESDGEVSKLSIVADVAVDGHGFLSFDAKVVEKLSDALVSVGVFAVRVNDPDLARSNSTATRSSCQSSILSKRGIISLTWRERRLPCFRE